jgi:hypothetical protein
MTTSRIQLGGLVAALLAMTTPQAWAVVNGGGAAKADCYSFFDGVDATTGPTTVVCKDGDPCDADGVVDHQCTFNVSVCSPGTVAGCTAQAVTAYSGSWVTKGYPVPTTPTGTDPNAPTCGNPQSIVVPLKQNKKGKFFNSKPVVLKLVSTTSAKPKKDVDKLKLVCAPAPPACPTNPNGGASQLTLTSANTGSDLDTGESGKSHNFIVPNGSQLKYCLTGCDGSTNPVCQGSGTTGDRATTLNGPTFGPPLPLFSANVAVCVVNRYADATITTTINLQDGSFDASTTPIRLLADTYQGSATQVCPKCVAGKCDSASRNPGAACTVDGTVTVNNPPAIVNAKYPVSRDCLPAGNPLGTPNVALNLTTATSTLQGNAAGTFPCPGQVRHDECNLLFNGGYTCTADCSTLADPKGGKNQTCCTNPQSLPCFPTDPATGIGKIVRTGNPVIAQPPWPDPTYPKKVDGGVLAATFCIPSTSAPLVDLTAGLPGPGSLLLPGSLVFTQ